MAQTEKIFWIAKASDEEAIEQFLRATSAVHQNNSKIQIFTVATSAGPNHINIPNGEDLDIKSLLADERVKSVLQWLSSGVHARFETAVVKYKPSPIPELRFKLIREVSHDQFVVEWNSAEPTAVANILDIINQQYNIISDQEVLARDTAEAIDLQSSLVTQLVQSSAEASANLHHAIGVEAKNLLEQTTTAAQQIHEQSEKQRAEDRKESDKKEAKLKEAVEEFETQKREFNDKKSTLVRRELLVNIRAELEEHGREFSLSEKTNRKTWPIQAACAILATVGLTGLGTFGFMIVNTTFANLQHLVPFSTSVLLLVSTAIFYIRWHNNWLNRHANLEIRNQVFNYDMLRASWFAELLFEYKDEKQQPLPESVIEVLTKNLFEEQVMGSQATHPAEDVVSFLKRINRIKFGDSEVELGDESKPRNKKKD